MKDRADIFGKDNNGSNSNNGDSGDNRDDGSSGKLKGKSIRDIWFYKKIVLFTAAAAIILIALDIVTVDGISMLPTLDNSDRLVIERLTYFIRTPKPMDIVVFKYPANPGRRLVKRVIAVEGDRVRIDGSRLVINSRIIYEPYILEKKLRDFPEVVVPEDTIFVLGDNRNNSRDSRDSDIGFIKLKYITGRVIFRIYPLNKVERIK